MPGEKEALIAMEVVGVRVELPSNQPIVLLRESDGPRYLPIWIGGSEATAIATALEGVVPPRPLTHDLMRSVIDALGALAVRVVITEMRDSVFYADLSLDISGREVHVSSRPSDAIALAVRTGTPVFAFPSVARRRRRRLRGGRGERRGRSRQIQGVPRGSHHRRLPRRRRGTIRLISFPRFIHRFR